MDHVDNLTRVLGVLVLLVTFGKSVVAGVRQVGTFKGRKARAEALRRGRRGWCEGDYLRSQTI